ncbi:hypothetical protein A1507_08350 [Methylomonas koyamae]|uniref:DUF5615 domain-containing protein n=1 Tax=Methylomonas koyamae TaxID=702114 RepID=A0A177NLV6_9GAMM|nr:DUF5615 family PIN-like protein [Methylomonas koyamae]OAI18905.1 hypothetical protein A1507_08350 [Methylomonas koyamae]
MKFLVDAQLPRQLAVGLNWRGHDTLHTLDLPLGNRTSDTEMNRISVEEQRVVISKDADFVNSFLLFGKPFKLLLISVGNISNRTLLELFDKNLPMMVAALASYDFIELTASQLIQHR